MEKSTWFRDGRFLLNAITILMCLAGSVSAQTYLGTSDYGEIPVGDERRLEFRISVDQMLYSNCRAKAVIQDRYALNGYNGEIRINSISHNSGAVLSRGASLTVSTSFKPSLIGNSKIRFYLTAKCSENVHGSRSFYYDVVGYGKVSQNLIATPPRQNSDGSLTYGYRVGSRPWNPAGNYVETQLFWAAGNRPLKRIAGHHLQTSPNAFEEFTVPMSAIPSKPAEATHILTSVDHENRIPETTEDDNRISVSFRKPDIQVIPPSYEADGTLVYGYKVANYPFQEGIRVRLYYASGTSQSNFIGEHFDELFIRPRPGAEEKRRLSPGQFPLPPYKATHVIAIADIGGLVSESDEGNNKGYTNAQAARGYERILDMPDVRVYKRDSVFVTAVDLRGAKLSHQAEPFLFGGKPTDWWQWLSKNENSTRKLVASVNGTIFGKLAITGANYFNYGLKIDGEVLDIGADTSKLNLAPWLFTFDNEDRSASIVGFSQAYMDSPQYPQVIGVIKGTRVVNSTDRLQWVAVRDYLGRVGALGEPRFRTILFLTTAKEVRPDYALNELKAWGVPSSQIGQLDGGGSASLVVDPGKVLVNTETKLGLRRPFVHGIGIFSRR